MYSEQSVWKQWDPEAPLPICPGSSLFLVQSSHTWRIVPQHTCLLSWLATLSFQDILPTLQHLPGYKHMNTGTPKLKSAPNKVKEMPPVIFKEEMCSHFKPVQSFPARCCMLSYEVSTSQVAEAVITKGWLFKTLGTPKVNAAISQNHFGNKFALPVFMLKGN